MTATRRDVRIVEVGPRDGLQNEPVGLSTDEKVELVEKLAETGLSEIEVTSFVRPDRIPNLQDAEEVSRRIMRRPGIAYWALVPNEKGLARAKAAGYRAFAFFMSASEAHNRRNVNRTVAESLLLARALAEAASAGAPPGEGRPRLRAYLSTSFGCPYAGPVPPERVAELAEALVSLGYDEVSLGDTIGAATPREVEEVLAAVATRLDLSRIALHFHDTRGMAAANALVGYRLGVRAFDASVGGLGGCPYAPGAAGNVATEDLVYLFEGIGAATGVDLDRLVAVARWLGGRVGHELPSHLARAGRRWWRGEATAS